MRKGQINIPRNAPTGTWGLEIFVEDCLGNACVLSSRDLAFGSFRVGDSSRPGDDTDGDCISNLLERAFALDSLVPDWRYVDPATGRAGLPLIEPVAAPGGMSLRITWIQRTGDSLLRYIPQLSTGLNDWQDLPVDSATRTPAGEGLEILSITTPVISGPRAFGRVKVVQP